MDAKTREERTRSFMKTAQRKGDKEFYYLHALLCADLFWTSDAEQGHDIENPSALFDTLFDTSLIAKRLDEILGYK